MLGICHGVTFTVPTSALKPASSLETMGNTADHASDRTSGPVRPASPNLYSAEAPFPPANISNPYNPVPHIRRTRARPISNLETFLTSAESRPTRQPHNHL